MNEPPQKKHPVDLETAALSAFVLFVCLFGNLGAVGLVGPDEPRYAWIARAMAATGDWVTPRLYGQPWFEKPILYYWAAAIGFRLHLPAEWALRLPSAIAALAVAIALGWLASKLYGRGARLADDPALLAPLLFSTTVAAIGFARAATPDMLFSASIALAMVSAAVIFRRAGLLPTLTFAATLAERPEASSRDLPAASLKPAHTSKILPLILFGGFLGLGVLAKGPAAVLLAGGAVALWALATKRWRAIPLLAHPYALASFCIVALPWYILCARRNPDFIQVFIFQHNFARYLTPVFQHRQPFWFFVPITLLAVLPWTVLLWPLAQDARRTWRQKSWQDSPGFFFACWAIFPILFFSFSQSKLPSYILPAVAPLAMLFAATLSCTLSLEPRRAAPSRIGLAIASTWLVLAVAAIVWLHRLPAAEHDAIGSSTWLAATLACLGAVAIALLALRRHTAFVAVSCLLVTALVGLAGIGILPRLDPFISARWHSQLLQNDRHPDRIFIYRLPRAWSYGLAFYLGRELPEWSPSDPLPALVLTTPAGFKEIRQLHRFFGDLEETVQGIVYVPIGPSRQ